MPTGIYKRTSEMKTGKYLRTPEMMIGKYPRTKEHKRILNKSNLSTRFKKGHLGFGKRLGRGISYNRKEYFIRKPWIKTYCRIITRCIYDKNSSYYKRGIKCLITTKELEIIWFRDKAYSLKFPSIHRKNHKGNYIFNNCEYKELNENLKKKG